MTGDVPARRFGATTLFLGGELPGRLEAIRRAGFGATEFLGRDLFESLRGVEYTLGLLRDSGLRVSIFQLLRDLEGAPRGQIEQRLGIAAQILDLGVLTGADTVALAANTDPASSGDTGMILEDLGRLGDLAVARGMRIAFESLSWATHLADYREGWEIVRRLDHPGVGLMLDASHIGALGLPFDAIRDIDPAKVFLAELADLPHTRLDIPEVSRSYRLFPGEGMLPLEEYVRALEAIGYAGDYSVEVLSDHYRLLDPVAVAQRAFDSMAGLWRRAMGG
ncbi:sugar phosphate isomerase/epimerase [Roseomonas sp. OT10]|uniref:sugar phosphate isomerase/epimerase family protein n=1 Tax=Roseomonas cutis TaxID=2897332 RepID=UPI001E38FA3A|nr:sugar phosphate isomerase/epimerase [Roseomonas sp. OT10]UFN47151.1 sugar phosphate isomerase/epimerase [Roseomonas sp. OT10]